MFDRPPPSSTVRDCYLAALEAAMARSVAGDAAAALDAFLTLNAAYFLGEWVPGAAHGRLVCRLAARLDGLATVTVPDDETAALQLAQHVRELAAAFGATPWTSRISALTVDVACDRGAERPGPIGAATVTLARGGDGNALLRAHARRRLWELTNPPRIAPAPSPPPSWALAMARRAVARADGHALQVAEALLAEVTAPLPQL